jgi:hypothetical protein
VTVGRWEVLDYDSEVAWLAELDGEGHATGFDAGGWPSSIWVLNTMYELEVAGPVPTSDELHRERRRRGLTEPALINGIDLDELTAVTGVGLGLAQRPHGPGGRRIRWSDLANRLGASFADQRHPPSFLWFPFSGWPANLVPPDEGSLDEPTRQTLVTHLIRHSGPACLASYGLVSAGARHDVDRCFTGPLRHLADLVGGPRPGTPSNVWPADRSWLLWTDWDLGATKVNGTPALIADIQADPDLETITWP